jgi:hypothetical protein
MRREGLDVFGAGGNRMRAGTVKLVLILLGVFCFVVLRSWGVDLKLYKAALVASQQTSRTDVTPAGQEKNYSYRVSLKCGHRMLGDYWHRNTNAPMIYIEAVMDEPVYSGNYYMPFVKNFTMSYTCTFATAMSFSGRKVEGTIKGTIAASVYGLCGQRLAKRLAFNRAVEGIMSHFRKDLGH